MNKSQTVVYHHLPLLLSLFLGIGLLWTSTRQQACRPVVDFQCRRMVSDYARFTSLDLPSVASMGVWHGVALDSLKYHSGPHAKKYQSIRWILPDEFCSVFQVGLVTLGQVCFMVSVTFVNSSFVVHGRLIVTSSWMFLSSHPWTNYCTPSMDCQQLSDPIPL
jgi:hypothetical protein